MQLSPDTAGKPETHWNERGEYTGWDHCPGYYYPDNVVIGFSHTHVQGTGGGDLGDVLLMPVVEGRNWAWDAGVPQTVAQEQITELGLDSGWVFEKRCQDIVLSSRMSAKLRTRAITASTCSRPTCRRS